MKNHNKKYFQILFLLLTLLTTYCQQLNATIRYVSKSGNSTPPYLTWETAADSIQKCINICVFGDTIYVANGVYQEQVEMINGLSLIGAGSDSCWIDSRLFAASGSVAVAMKDSCLIKGFYILASNDYDYGYGIYTFGQTGMIMLNKFSNANTGIVLNNTQITVYKNYFFNLRRGISIGNSNSIVRKNEIYMSSSTGAGVNGIFITAFSSSYQPIIDSNYIVSNYGTGIRKSIGASPIIKNNTIQFIQYGAQGIYLSDSDSASVYNNLILIGTGQTGIYNYNVPYVKIINNYILGSPAGSPLGMLVGGSNVVKNNVVVNTVTGIQAGGIQNLVVQNNNFWDNSTNAIGFTPDTTNLSVDPMIVNDDTTKGELDFHLQKYSPLIDAGDPNILDKDGTRSDIGLYGGPYGESYLYQDLAPKAPRGLFASVDTSFIELNWQKNTESDFSHYNLYRDTTSNFAIDSTKLVGSVTDTFYLHSIPIEVNRLYFKLTGVDNQGNESNPSEEVAVLLVSVKNEWKPVNNYILYQNYPNPFNPTTTIGYKLKERAYVKLYVYDVKGELIEVLVNQTQESGYYEVEFNGDGKIELTKVKNPFVSGVYLCQIIIQSEKGIPVFSDVKKMILLK